MKSGKNLTRKRQKALNVFLSFSHKDSFAVDELLDHLKLLERQQLIKVWCDRQIVPDEEWEQQLLKQLNNAHIVLMLVSAAFIRSDYCYTKEMPLALARFKARRCLATWVLLYSCQWRRTPLSKLQGQPIHGKALPPVRHEREQMWTLIADMIADYVKRYRAKKRTE